MSKKAKPATAPPEKQEPSPAQIAEMVKVNERRAARRPAVPVEVQASETIKIDATVTDHKLYFERLLDITGTRDDEWMNGVVRALASVNSANDPDASADGIRQGLAFLNGLGPKDEIEAALGVQMFSMHRLAMTAGAKAANTEYQERWRDYTNVSVKAARTFVAQVEALAKLRSGGQQQVIVKHIYVDARGGQNVIGSDIQTPARGAP